MRTVVTRSPVFALALSLVLVGTGCEPSSTASVSLRNLAPATPEDVGMSSERLTLLHDAMQGLVDEGRLAGITTMIARSGRIADFQTYGFRDMAAGDSMTEDAIFRIFSMSKPITGVALMMLHEEGKFRLSDPVRRYIPELADMMVAASWGPDGPVLEDADRPMTIRDLMTHTAGLAYGIGDPHPADRLYARSGVLDMSGTLEDMIDKLAGLPLRFQPGTQWSYSISVDVQGYLVEVLSGQPFDEFLQERVFDPLGMEDTGFHVPAESHGRFAQVYFYDDEGNLTPPPESDNAIVSMQFLEPATFFSGGGGLVSTTMDYMRFCQMLLNGGELDGVRLLSPTTVDMIRTNHLPREMGEYAPGQGFGLDFSVVLDPVEAGSVSGGEYFWGGAAGTWFWIDPVEDLIFVGMIQQFGGRVPDVRSLSRQLTYAAITESRGQNHE
ncbi:MAG: beta-lactamase family protein [Gemmatimonadetes bacterium]|nr:beta-lactamase family protein [Gemmatimonadota bacterium]NNM06674.1 beta-lactamase family protein [Gemmatimonadota bacterium]